MQITHRSVQMLGTISIGQAVLNTVFVYRRSLLYTSDVYYPTIFLANAVIALTGVITVVIAYCLKRLDERVSRLKIHHETMPGRQMPLIYRIIYVTGIICMVLGTANSVLDYHRLLPDSSDIHYPIISLVNAAIALTGLVTVVICHCLKHFDERVRKLEDSSRNDAG